MEDSQKKPKRLLSPSTPKVILALALLFAANIIMAIVMVTRAHNSLRKQIDIRMLDICNSAANLLNGDDLRDMTEADIGSEKYDKALGVLRIFQNNIELSYIYLMDAGVDGEFHFTIDPDPESPASFGMLNEATPALIAASEGTPSVDQKPHTDQWGKFYSAFSPVYDSRGDIVAIIGADFEANRFIGHITTDILLISSITLITMIIGILMGLDVVRSSHKRFDLVHSELKTLREGFEKMNDAMRKSSIEKLNDLPAASENSLLKTLASGDYMEHHQPVHDEMTALTDHLHFIQNTMRHYMSYIDSQTHLDPMTGVGNRIAYKNTLTELEVEIHSGKSAFAVGFFDINELRQVNTLYGFEIGDAFLYEVGSILKRVFQQKNVYRVASDEFIVIMRGKNLTDMDSLFEKFDKELDAFNKKNEYEAKLSVSKGCSAHYEDSEENYRLVFRHAEEAEKRNKEMYYSYRKKSEA